MTNTSRSVSTLVVLLGALGLSPVANAAPGAGPTATKQLTIDLSERQGKRKLSSASVVLPIPELLVDSQPLALHQQYWAQVTTRMRDEGPAQYCAFAVRRATVASIEMKVRCGERHALSGTTPLELDVRVVRSFSSRKRFDVATIQRPGGRSTVVTASVK